MSKRKKPRRVTLGLPDATDNGGLHMAFIGSNVNLRIAKAYSEVVRALCKARKGFAHKHEKQLIPCSYCLHEVGTFDADIPPKLRELWDAIEAVADAAFTHGKEQGSSLILGLARGDITIHELNRETIGDDEDA